MSFEAIQKRLDGMLRNCLQSVARIQEKKLNFLQSVRRQYLAQLLMLEWCESFASHVRMSLPPKE